MVLSDILAVAVNWRVLPAVPEQMSLAQPVAETVSEVSVGVAEGVGAGVDDVGVDGPSLPPQPVQKSRKTRDESRRMREPSPFPPEGSLQQRKRRPARRDGPTV